MFFQTLEFIIFFVILTLLYYTLARRFQWQLLLAASLFFYAFSGWWNLLYIVTTVASTYAASRGMGRIDRAGDVYLSNNTLSKDDIKAHKRLMKAKRRRWLIACLVFNFSVLAATKYAGLMITRGGDPGFFGYLVPMGISFYTFQAMSYLIDRYRRKGAEENNPFRLALFVSFFPQLIQGPISRFNDLKETLFEPHKYNAASFSEAGQRVLWGFFKKLVIADRLMPAVIELTSNPGESGIGALMAVFLYAVTLYADFTGGIDVTIGVAGMLGVRVKENFNMPFYSKSIAEYWRRWHITMGTWFKDYLFYPISVSKPMLGFTKRAKAVFGDNLGKRLPVYLSTIILWFLTGLWHGATANFITWGLVNGLVIIISQELTPLYKSFHGRFNFKGKGIWNAFEIFRTFWLMCFIRSFDIYAGVGETLKAISSVFTGSYRIETLFLGGLSVSDYLVAGVGVAAMIITGVIKRRKLPEQKPEQCKTVTRYAVCLTLALAIVVFGTYGIGYDAAQFIYNRF